MYESGVLQDAVLLCCPVVSSRGRDRLTEQQVTCVNSRGQQRSQESRTPQLTSVSTDTPSGKPPLYNNTLLSCQRGRGGGERGRERGERGGGCRGEEGGEREGGEERGREVKAW